VSPLLVPSRILVVGAAGRLGRVICEELAAAGHLVLTKMTQADLDVTNEESIARSVADSAPQIVINCSAYNAVDRAESEPEAAYAVNARGPGWLAKAAASAGALLVHYSTDFVFDGAAATPYVEDDPVNPVSVYGSSKLAGEVEVRSACPRHYILRVESLFGGTGIEGHRATIDYIADTLNAGGTVKAFVDRTVSPSYVPDVVYATRELIARGAPHGTYHCVSTGMTNWYDIAQHVAAQLGVQGHIESIASSDPPGKARRPRFCALSNDKLRAAGIEMPDWKSTITRHLRAIAATTPNIGNR
jgi:dTDP-4-dehydrorhamnose reductase